MNAEDNTASCWKKAITIHRRILVVSVLKIQLTSSHNISSGSCLLRTKIKLAPVSDPAFHPISHQPGRLTSCNTGLKVISTHRNSPANRASPPHIIRPLVRWSINNSDHYVFSLCPIDFNKQRLSSIFGKYQVGTMFKL